MDIGAKLRTLLIEELNLEDVDPDDLERETVLFGDGLGLDSLDAVELVVLVQKHFGVEISDMEEGKKAFQNLGALEDFISERQS